MALTADEQRKCYLHLRVLQVNRTGYYVGGQPMTLEATQRLQTALDHVTANGETSVRELLAVLDDKRTKLGTLDTRFQAAKVRDIELQPEEFKLRLEQYDFWRMELAAALDVKELLAQGGSLAGAQGPWREP